MSEARIDRITNENNTAGPIISGITTFSGQNFFVPPKGTTAQRPSNCPPGSIRFNTDSAKLEYFDNLQWLELEAFNVEIGISTNAAGTSGGLGNRGVFGGYYISPSATTTIEFITISTTGNAIDFGDLSTARRLIVSCSSSTRGLLAGGFVSSLVNTIEFITISSTGNSQDFGDLTAGVNRFHQACSSATRGLVAGGQGTGYAYRNNIEYVTIASTGDSVDFGELSRRINTGASLSSSTRGIFAGGYNDAAPALIEFITISTLGDAVSFGNLTVGRYSLSGCSNATRGVFAGGSYPAPSYNIIDYITIASTGNAQDFGDLTDEMSYLSACSSSIRGVFGGGTAYPSETNKNAIEFVSIATLGNVTDFGDLSSPQSIIFACSNGHGGL